ncbi:hypothetical protein [Streptomyces sp. DHE17-7]|uniref:hypothetical protein n=1 Tax=Streptomyces sp. DHE17-7 TaxID=2759949 RepID=UPI0022EB738E|nr:hypothetical protein [Streptomyces sp. DHE17-7]MBJ6621555.1 hypothetical protein [Streptomyces sp. DHE17-7]
MRSRKSLVGSLVAATVLSAGMGVTAAAPAQAAGKARPVPSCVKTATFNQPSVYTVQVRNTCKGAMKVKVQMKYGTDHPCTTIAKGKTVHFNSKGIKVYTAPFRCLTDVPALAERVRTRGARPGESFPLSTR